MIVKKEFNGNTRGRDSRYNFAALTPGDCLIIEPRFSESTDINKFRSKVSTALYQWKKYNNLNWETAVRVSLDSVSVYRIR